MSSDFGDESGEKFCDWLLAIGENAGNEAMHTAAQQLSLALRKTRGEKDIDDPSEKWARLKLDELANLEGYDTIKQILDNELNELGIEHSFFTDKRTATEVLLFKHSDAKKVDQMFGELISNVDQSLKKATFVRAYNSREPKEKLPEMDRDCEPLETRASRVRASAAVLMQSKLRKPLNLGRSSNQQEVSEK